MAPIWMDQGWCAQTDPEALMGTVRGCRGDRRAASPAVSASIWDLVAAAQRGDREAFGRLYDRHVEAVDRYALARVGDRPLAEDLTGQVFLRAWRGIGSLHDQHADIGAWLVSIAHQLASSIPVGAPHPGDDTPPPEHTSVHVTGGRR